MSAYGNTGLFTFRLKALDVALKRMRNPEPSKSETMLLLQLGRERIAENVTREEAAALVRARALEALGALLDRPERFPVSLIVCSTVSVAIDPHDGLVTQLIAAPDSGGSMSVEVVFSEPTREVAALKRRATDAEPEADKSDVWGTLMRR